MSTRDTNISFGEYLRKSLCAIIPKPPNAIPEDRIAPDIKTLLLEKRSDDKEASVQILLGKPSIQPLMVDDKFITHAQKIPTDPRRKKKSSMGAKIQSIATPSSLPSQARIKTTLAPTNVHTGGSARSLTGTAKIYYNLRTALDCGDVYAECLTDEDCGSLEVCVGKTDWGGYCAPDPTHCANSGCSSGETCNLKTGECELETQSCETDEDCGNGYHCADNTCYRDKGYCESDVDCIEYREDGVLKNICNVEKRQCVECYPRRPSTCGRPEYGKDPDKPVCSPIPNENICFYDCKKELTDETKFNSCCDNTHRPYNQENCCGDLPALDSPLKDLKVEKCCASSYLEWFKDGWGTRPSPLPAESRASKCCEATLRPDGTFGLDDIFDSLGYPRYYRCMLNEANNFGPKYQNVTTEEELEALGGRSCSKYFGGKSNSAYGTNSQCPTGYKCDKNNGKCVPS